MTLRSGGHPARPHGADEFAALLRDSPTLAAMIAHPGDGRILHISRGMETLLDMSAARMRGSHLQRWFLRPGDFRRVCGHLDRAGSLVNLEAAMVNAAGDQLVACVSGQVIDFGGERAMLLVFADMSEYRWRMDITSYDPLTALPSRNQLDDRLGAGLRQAERSREKLGVLFLDLDGFKAVNDCHGHAMGDRLLSKVAQRLASSVRGSDTVARIGGDEFVILLSHLLERRQAECVADNLSRVLARPISVDSRSLQVGVSIGVAIYPEDGKTSERLLHHADAAMYRAKAARTATCGRR